MLPRTIRLVLEYDGTRYAGWQLQRDAATVQGVLEAALGRILNHPVRVAGAGRTDAGVHALGQVAHFKTTSRLSPAAMLKGLNALLPPDVAVRSAAEAEPGFDARRKARGKIYRYRILNRREKSALEFGRAWHLREPLDLEAMRRAGSAWVGRHDFSAFRASGCQAKNPVRVVKRLEVRSEPEGIVAVEIEASAFLQHMARTMVGTLVEIGRGKWPEADAAALLRGGDRARSGPTAPAHGLYLVKVFYDEGRNRDEA